MIFFYLDHTTTNLVPTNIPEYTPQSKLNGIKYINDQSKFLIERMSSVGVRPSQLTIMLELLDESDGTFQTSTTKNLIRKCELIHQKELGIDHNMSTAEKAMDWYDEIMNSFCFEHPGHGNSSTANRSSILLYLALSSAG